MRKTINYNGTLYEYSITKPSLEYPFIMLHTNFFKPGCDIPEFSVKANIENPCYNKEMIRHFIKKALDSKSWEEESRIRISLRKQEIEMGEII